MFRHVRENVPNSTRQTSLSTATTISAWRSRIHWPVCAPVARQVECTINGIGERAGNAALEEVVMAIRTRPATCCLSDQYRCASLNRASKLVAAATSSRCSTTRPSSAGSVRARERHPPGRHAQHTQTYEIMTPESVGVSKTSLVMGKHSGRNALPHKLKGTRLRAGENALEDAFNRFKALADRKKHVYDEDLEALVDEEIATQQDRIKVVSLTVIAGTVGPQSATLTLDMDGKHETVQATGNGPVDATFNAIMKLILSGEARLLPGACRDRGHGCPGRGSRCGSRMSRKASQSRRALPIRYHGGVCQGLCRRPQHTDGQAGPHCTPSRAPKRHLRARSRLRVGPAPASRGFAQFRKRRRCGSARLAGAHLAM